MQSWPENQQNVPDTVLGPPAPPAMGPMPAISGLGSVSPAQEADSHKFKVRSLINELIQTGNTFSGICQQITGVLIRNYVLIAQHIPPEKLNTAILNFFTLAAVPKKSGYTLASHASTDRRIFQSIELIEKDSHDAILQEFFPQYDTEQGAWVEGSQVAEMLEEWAALLNLTVFYNDQVNALSLNISQDQFSSPKDSDREPLFGSFVGLFEQLLAHCDQPSVNVATQEWRRFLLIRVLVPSEIQWQTILQDVANKYALDLATLSDPKGFMQCLVNGSALLKSTLDSTEASFGQVIAERIFSITQPRHPRFTQAQVLIGGDRPIIFQVMMSVTWAKQTNSMRNGRYPNDFDIVTQQLIASVQRLPRLELFFTSIEKYIDVDTPNFLQIVKYIRAQISEQLKKVDSDMKPQKTPSRVEGRDAKPRSVIKNKGRLAGEIGRLKTLVRQGVGNIGEMFLRDSGRIHYNDNADKRRRKTMPQSESRVAVSAPVAPNLPIVSVPQPVPERGQAPVPRKQHLPPPPAKVERSVESFDFQERPTELALKPEIITKPPAAPASPTKAFRSHWVAPIGESAPAAPPKPPIVRRARRVLRTRQPVFVVPTWVKKSSAVVLGILFLASLVTLIGTLTSGQLPFSATLGHIEFVKSLTELLKWGKDVFLGIFIGSSSSIGALLLACVFAIIDLKRGSAEGTRSTSHAESVTEQPVSAEAVSSEGYSVMPTQGCRPRQDDNKGHRSNLMNAPNIIRNMPNP